VLHLRVFESQLSTRRGPDSPALSLPERLLSGATEAIG
jgi:hypothetical protein